MQRKHLGLTCLITTVTCAILALSAFSAQAQEKKADPTGTWTWSTPGRGDNATPRVSTLKLKLDGEKLTGTISMGAGRQGGQARETAIENGKIKGDEISFSVTREFNNNKMVSKYNGKLSGDTIKGKVEMERNGESQPARDWEAKRSAEKK